MEQVSFTLFSDTGGILLLDPLNAPGLGEEFVRRLDVALDPEGATEQAVELNGDWPAVRARAVAELRRMSAGGEFTLVLSGEGTFNVRVQTEDLTSAERAAVIESFVERIRVRSGRLIFTDGREIFGEELPGEGAQSIAVPPGLYDLHLHHLERHESLTPTIGIYGSADHPALIARLVPAESEDAAALLDRDFPRLRPSHQGYQEPQPGWDCYAQVTAIESGRAELELMLTETTYSGHARMSVPEGEDLSAGDYVLVRLIEQVGNYWEAEWQEGSP